MPAKPLSPQQLDDAARLKTAFLEAQRSRPDLSQEQLAYECGWKTQGAASQYLNGKIPLNLRALVRFAKVIGVKPESISPSLAAELTASGHHEFPRENTPARPVNPTRSKAGLVEVLLLDTKTFAAHGQKKSLPTGLIGRIWLNSEQLSREVSFTTPTNLALTTASGDTMEGTFNAGDLLLVDRGINEVRQDAVYVLTLDGALYIKRLQRLPEGKLLMISDNRKYEPVLIDYNTLQSFEVLGRVLMVWNSRML